MALHYLTAGESHGRGLAGILEGLPSGLEISVSYIQKELKRRKTGFGRGARQTIEDDAVELLTGVRHGKTLGSPICLLIFNKDWKNWQEIMQVDSLPNFSGSRVTVPRPGHADLVGSLKYRHSDIRNVLERASARETTMRVALASVVRRFLNACDISVASRVVRIGSVVDESPLSMPVADLNSKVDLSPVRCLSPEIEKKMVAEVQAYQSRGDTVGGVFEVYASGVPVGLGSYSQWDRRLEGNIGKQFMSLNALKGVEIGLGFAAGAIPGSQAHDEILPGIRPGKVKYASNRSGGINGGMTTGQTLVIRAAMKPLATLMQPLKSVDLETNKAMPAHVERSDACAVPAAAVIGESLLALSLAEAILDKFGGDSMSELLPRVKEWNETTTPE